MVLTNNNTPTVASWFVLVFDSWAVLILLIRHAVKCVSKPLCPSLLSSTPIAFKCFSNCLFSHRGQILIYYLLTSPFTFISLCFNYNLHCQNLTILTIILTIFITFDIYVTFSNLSFLYCIGIELFGIMIASYMFKDNFFFFSMFQSQSMPLKIYKLF